MGQEKFEEVLPPERTRAAREFGFRKWKRPLAMFVSMRELDKDKERQKPKLS